MAAMSEYRRIAKKVFWEFDSIIMQNLSDILPWASYHVDFENLQKRNFCKTKFSFLFFKEPFPQFPQFSKISEIIVFIHILQIVFGLQSKLLFWTITHEKSKESFPFGEMFSRTFFAYMQPLNSFVSYPASDNKVVIRFLENRWVRRRESISLAFKIPVLS